MAFSSYYKSPIQGNSRLILFTQRSNLIWRRNLLTTSYVEGPTEPPLLATTFPEYFAKNILAKHASRPALISRQEKPRAHGGPSSYNMNQTGQLAWDFEELDRHVMALTAGLVDLGVNKGDRVAVIMGNCRCSRNED